LKARIYAKYGVTDEPYSPPIEPILSVPAIIIPTPIIISAPPSANGEQRLIFLNRLVVQIQSQLSYARSRGDIGVSSFGEKPLNDLRLSDGTSFVSKYLEGKDPRYTMRDGKAGYLIVKITSSSINVWGCDDVPKQFRQHGYRHMQDL